MSPKPRAKSAGSKANVRRRLRDIRIAAVALGCDAMRVMPTKRIIVTGGSGKAGHWIVKHLVEEGYDVINIDSRRPAVPQCRTIVADLTQTGQVVTAFSPHGTGNRTPYDGVIHLAAIPRAHEQPNDEIFRINSLTTYNVLEPCGLL